MAKLLLTIFAFSLILFACKKSPKPVFHEEYFGLTPGRYVIYDVREILHDQALAKHDTLYYQLKTVWGTTYIDNEGREANEYYRYKRVLESDPWVLKDTWTGLIDGVRAELIEENQRRIKLVFAPTLNKFWNENAYNNGSVYDCYYRDIHSDTLINGHQIDSTLVVEQVDFTSLIDTVRKYEMYSKNIGLIYKHSIDNHYQFSSNEVVDGHEIIYTYNSAGFE
jgi:hypothetical protein